MVGTMRHHAIAVTDKGYPKAHDRLIKVHDLANSMFGCLVTGIVRSHWNGHHTFFVAPDGSKEGWDESDNFDVRREELIGYIESFANSDGSNPLTYAEFFYGDDYGESAIVRHNGGGGAKEEGV